MSTPASHARAARGDAAVALVRERVLAPAPLDALADVAGAPAPALLETVASEPGGGRHSVLAWDPRAALVVEHGATWLVTNSGAKPAGPDPFAALDGCLAERGPAAPPPDGLPFASGFIGYLGYGLRHAVERLPDLGRPGIGAPDAWLGWYDGALVWDHATGTCEAVGRGRRGERFVAQVSVALRRGDALGDVRADPRPLPMPDPAGLSPPFALAPWDSPASGVTTSLPRAAYMAAVTAALVHIAAGDCYQLNLSQQIHVAAATSPLAAYRALRARAPEPWAAYLATGGGILLGASPECFLRRRGADVETRPIKGTRARDADAAADRANAQALLASAKEQAELDMIVDLCRSDLGRVAVTGSVAVAERRVLESHRTVHHTVATVRATLAAGVSVGALLRATFPAGSVTGCPKIRAMAALEALEPVARGPYCGAYGLVDASGDCALAMTIRSALWRGGGAAFGAGGGIVADSDPAAEWAESVLKARALLEALAP